MDEGEGGRLSGTEAATEETGRSPGASFTPLTLGSPGFRRLFHASDHGMVITDDSRRYLAVNQAATRLFGLAADRIVGRRIDDFTTAELLPVLPVMWAEFLEAGTLAGPYEIRVGSRQIQLDFAATANIAPGRHLAILLTPAPEHEPEHEATADAGRQAGLLSTRERDVLALLAHGLSADEAAAELGVARNTIQNHLRSARAKLGAKTRSHAIALAIGRGEIPVEQD